MEGRQRWADLDEGSTDLDEGSTDLDEGSVGKCTESRPRWADLDDSDAEDLPTTGATFLAQKPLENRPVQIPAVESEDLPCSLWQSKALLPSDAEPAQIVESHTQWSARDTGQRKSKPARGKRGGVGRNPVRQAPRSHSNWDVALLGAGHFQQKSGGDSLWHTGGRQWKDGARAVGWRQQAETWEPRISERKQQCQFILGITEESKFRVVRRLLGSGGMHVKAIAEETGAKLRLRGVGSKFLEGPEKKESSDPLMLCVSALTDEGYDIAVKRIREHLECIYLDFHEFLIKNGEHAPKLSVRMHEGARLLF